MGDDQDPVEAVLNAGDPPPQLLTPPRILRAEAFVDEEAAQLRAGPPCQQTRQRYPDGEVDAEGLAAGVQLIGPGAELVGDQNVERFAQLTGLGRSLRFDADVHPAVAHAREQLIGGSFELRDDGFDDHRRYAPFGEGLPQVFVLGESLGQLLTLPLPLLSLLFEAVERRQLLSGAADPLVGQTLLHPEAIQLRLGHGWAAQTLFRSCRLKLQLLAL